MAHSIHGSFENEIVADNSEDEYSIRHRVMDLMIKADEDEMMMNIMGPDIQISKSKFKLIS